MFAAKLTGLYLERLRMGDNAVQPPLFPPKNLGPSEGMATLC